MGDKGIVSFAAGVLALVLSACSSSPSLPTQDQDTPPDAAVTGLHDATSPTGPTGDGGPTSGDDAGSGDFGFDAGSDDACSPPVATPQTFPGEVAQVNQSCGAGDGGAPSLVGPVPASTVIELDIGLPLRNQSELNELLNEISDPTSPEYRQDLTSAEFTAMFGPTVCDYDAVVAWAEAQGLTVTMTYSDRTLIDLSAPASVIDAAFDVTLNDYLRPDGSTFYAPDVDPSADLSVPILGPVGLDNCAVATPLKSGDP
jgi:hypothetical protein